MTTISLPQHAKGKVAPDQLKSALSTTPGQLKLAGVLVSFLALLLWFTAHSGIATARTAVQTIGKDTVPSIIAAQKIRADLADMDANANNGFFSRGTKAARQAYETDRHNAADMLVKAAQNITYGDEERAPILTITEGLEVYTGQIESARTLGFPKGLDTLRAASALMHTILLPASEALDTANFNHLNKDYEESKSSIPGSLTRILMLGAVTLLGLVGIQLFLFLRMKRIFNIPLAAATFILLIWLMATSNTIASIQHDLKVAKVDAFDSIDALMKARAVAYDANGDESLYLLEHGSNSPAEVVQQSERSFQQKVALIADSPLTPEVVAAAGNGAPTFKGYLGDELRNITFDGEKAAAIAALTTYAQYVEMDKHLRELETSGKHQEAVEFCTGTNEGQSNWGFSQFDDALGKVIDINQKAFDGRIEHGFRGLNWLPAGAVIAPLLVALLALLGLFPRIREYSH